MKSRLGAEGDEATQPVQPGSAQEGRGMLTSFFTVYTNLTDFLMGNDIGSSATCLNIACYSLEPSS